jgi:hypothetical protein
MIQLKLNRAIISRILKMLLVLEFLLIIFTIYLFSGMTNLIFLQIASGCKIDHIDTILISGNDWINGSSELHLLILLLLIH